MKTEKYADYSPSTKKYMGAVEEFLKNKYGKVNKEWNQGLMMLADNVENFNRCRQTIAVDGVMIKAQNGYKVKHPLLGVQKDLQASMTKLLTEFGLTPKAVAKLNLTSDTEDELKDLMGL